MSLKRGSLFWGGFVLVVACASTIFWVHYKSLRLIADKYSLPVNQDELKTKQSAELFFSRYPRFERRVLLQYLLEHQADFHSQQMVMALATDNKGLAGEVFPILLEQGPPSLWRHVAEAAEEGQICSKSLKSSLLKRWQQTDEVALSMFCALALLPCSEGLEESSLGWSPKNSEALGVQKAFHFLRFPGAPTRAALLAELQKGRAVSRRTSLLFLGYSHRKEARTFLAGLNKKDLGLLREVDVALNMYKPKP